MKCHVDWAGLGLDDEFGPCENPAAFLVTQACVHEHVTRCPACGRCGDFIANVAKPEEWWCERCVHLHGACPAVPVLWIINDGRTSA